MELALHNAPGRRAPLSRNATSSAASSLMGPAATARAAHGRCDADRSGVFRLGPMRHLLVPASRPPQFSAALDVLIVLGLILFDDAGVPWREVKIPVGGHPRLH